MQSGVLSPAMLEYLHCATVAQCSMLVSGGTGAGKTTALNALSSFIPDDQRIITVEDAAELRLQQPHVVRLESRPPNLEGRGQVTIRDLVKNALRMRPDRIIVGEVRGEEVLDMLQAMNTGHQGSLTTVHANNPQDAIGRMMMMLSMGSHQFTERAMTMMIGSAIQLIVQVARMKDGRRRMTHISEVQGVDAQGNLKIQDIFRYDIESIDAGTQTIRGQHRLVGQTQLRPRFRDFGVDTEAADLGVEARP